MHEMAVGWTCRRARMEARRATVVRRHRVGHAVAVVDTHRAVTGRRMKLLWVHWLGVVLVLPGKALLLVLRVALVLERLTGQPVPAQSRWAMTAMNAPRANATYCTGCLGIRHTMVGSLGGPLPA